MSVQNLEIARSSAQDRTSHVCAVLRIKKPSKKAPFWPLRGYAGAVLSGLKRTGHIVVKIGLRHPH